MKTLHLLRHAKSSWKDSDLDDHDRPLSKRGRQTAKTIAAYFRRAKIAPDLVICSTAARARQTLDAIAKAIGSPKAVLERGIYDVTQQKLWNQLWHLPESADCVLLIGHNPGLHDLALELADPGSAGLAPPRGGKFPTGAMASFRFDGAWKALQPHRAVLLSFRRPKAMKKEGRAITDEGTIKLVARANKKVKKATAAPHSAGQTAKAKKIIGKAAVTQPAKKTTANNSATRAAVQRATKASRSKAKRQRVTAARKAPPTATNVARQNSATRSISRRPSHPRVVPPSDQIERDSQDSFPASDAPGWTPITRIGTPIPPKRG